MSYAAMMCGIILKVHKKTIKRFYFTVGNPFDLCSFIMDMLDT